MSASLAVLTMTSQFTFLFGGLHTCIPNTRFLLNGRMCYCDNLGFWSESSCNIKRRPCEPGEVTRQACSRCICKNNQLKCRECPTTNNNPKIHSFNNITHWCTPFKIYYVNCSICVCPVSGNTNEAHCVTDVSCTLKTQLPISDLIESICLPKVMYLFPCLLCLCSDTGHFIRDKCIETCTKESSPTRCIPRTFYRNDCNVCQCPEDSIPDEKLCTQTICNSELNYVHSLRNQRNNCIPHMFTKPTCAYCECKSDGTVNEDACLIQDCLNSKYVKYDVPRETCSPGELVPVCSECYCPKNGFTQYEWCSKACSHQGKMAILENIIQIKDQLVVYPAKDMNEQCTPSSVYSNQERICLCPDNGVTHFNHCTSSNKNWTAPKTKVNKIDIDFTISCEPNTFVEFVCNTCFCSKQGTIDPRWCTYDDCEAKRIIQESHTIHSIPVLQNNTECIPGTISRVECNFCICADSGFINDNVCTKNDCSNYGNSPSNENFICEPLTYYEVDCNICFCPEDGLKNIAKCSKNHCETTLRTDVCIPGQLFSEECNVCVCPPNGEKADKACIESTCTDAAPWRKIFQISDTLLSHHIAETKKIDLCFPGEEFVIGCKLCVCPDLGLKAYATCSPVLCEEETESTQKIVRTRP